MSNARTILNTVLFDTFGGIATSSFVICALSGVAIAVPYDVNSAFSSVSDIMLSNPAASFMRNLHYWSAQFFFIFTLIHIIDHFVKRTEYDQRPGIWLALTLSFIPLFFVMISGFILKGDPDALQARQILSSLLMIIPWIGETVNYSIMGPPESLQLIYVNHVATATILIFIVIYEHVEKFWPVNFRFLVTTFILILFAYFFSAPLHDGIDPVMKGPWYFVGVQEILHWMSRPAWIWLAIAVLMLLFYITRRSAPALNLRIKQLFLFITFLYLLATAVGYFFRGENWEWKYQDSAPLFFQFPRVSAMTQESLGYEAELPLVLERKEGCLVCHDMTTGLSASHDPAALGCQSCHGGNPFTLLKDPAHRKLNRIPGNLSNASRSCGNANCHPGIPDRIERSIMTTLAGMVSVDRYVFGETDTLDALLHINNIGHSAADQHLRDLCAHCHIGHDKIDPGPVNQLSRGGGCTACHLNYTSSAALSLQNYLIKPDGSMADTFHHPSLDLRITNQHCFGCHSRSGRISTNYEGWHETLLEEAPEVNDSVKYRTLEDQRVFRYIESDVHYRAGMECVDCHLVNGIMGDGEYYFHQEDPVRISCIDCHRTDTTRSVGWVGLDEESRKIARLRGWDSQDRRFLLTRDEEEVMINAWLNNEGNAELHLKNSEKTLSLGPPAEVCTRGTVHDALSCQSCHSAWAPQCIGCHNVYDGEAEGYDLMERMEKEGTWVEFVGAFLADPPTLGVIEKPGEEKMVHTFVPGMILSIDRSSFPGNDKEGVFLRLFAPAATHTTSSKGRDCRSCHNDPLAMGYGRGALVFDGVRGMWTFTARFADNANDGLPEDAWTGFLEQRNDQAATRHHMRPFNIEEQEKVLRVGACLECHKSSSEVMQESLYGIEPLMERLSPECIVPFKE